MMSKRIILSVVLLCVSVLSMKAQQLPTYSQFLFNDYAYNPAVAGSKPYVDVKSGHRYQWVGLTDAPRTYSLSVSAPTKGMKAGLGAFLFTDHVGPTRRTGMQLSYAYHLKVSSKVKLSMSLSAGILEWKVDAHKIRLYDPNDQVIINGVMRSIVPDAKFGLYLYGENWHFGAVAPNLLQSKLKFKNADYTGLSKLEDHYYIHGGYKFELNDDFSLEPAALIKYVPAANPIQADVMAKIEWKEQLWLGGAYRTDDAASLIFCL